ncbi:MAG: coproporphyrinogen III oxidase, partial [Oscillospiraceae bacterium]|nr:coproporphyrinogen III oxidase [Oscillospiraceae bacterium]
ISNFSKKKYESRHNLKYWRCREYVGFGPAAHSYIGDMRYSNVSDVKKYIDRISKGETVVDHYDRISEYERASEYIMLGLRTRIGISRKEYDKLNALGMEPIEELLKKFSEYEWATYSKGRWRLTPKGFLVSNQLIGMLLDAQQDQRVINFNKKSGTNITRDDDEDEELIEAVPVFRGI